MEGEEEREAVTDRRELNASHGRGSGALEMI